jgi:hypothetical protein
VIRLSSTLLPRQAPSVSGLGVNWILLRVPSSTAGSEPVYREFHPGLLASEMSDFSEGFEPRFIQDLGWRLLKTHFPDVR